MCGGTFVIRVVFVIRDESDVLNIFGKVNSEFVRPNESACVLRIATQKNATFHKTLVGRVRKYMLPS